MSYLRWVLALVVLLVSLPGRLSPQGTVPWRDPSPHAVRFVTVDDNVKLEVLDWGGTGRPLVLLAGLGATAHVYDDFAPKLTSQYHVYGITRRGFGDSSAPTSGYSADRLGDDVLAVLDALKVARPVLVGHSIAGEELSSIATRHPERIEALVYLDAAYSYAFYDQGVANLQETQRKEPQIAVPPAPAPTVADRASYQTWHAWQQRTLGFPWPEGELHQIRDTTPDGHVGEIRNTQNAQKSVIEGAQKCTEIRVPTLAIFVLPHDLFLYARNDPVETKFEARDAIVTEAQVKAFEHGVASAHVVVLPHANHDVFMSNEVDVLREMRAFLASSH